MKLLANFHTEKASGRFRLAKLLATAALLMASAAKAAPPAVPEPPAPNLAKLPELQEDCRAILAQSTVGAPDAQLKAARQRLEGWLKRLPKDPAVAEDLAGRVVLPAVLEAVAALAEAPAPAAAPLPVAEWLLAALPPAKADKSWRLQWMLWQMAAIERGELGRAWSALGRQAALEWLFEAGDELADPGHDAYLPNPVCSAPPWLADRHSFCARMWLELFEDSEDQPWTWSPDAYERWSMAARKEREWARRYAGVAASLGLGDPEENDRFMAALQFELLTPPELPPGVAEGFGELLDEMDPCAVLLPMVEDKPAADRYAASRVAVPRLPMPALGMSADPVPYPRPAAAPAEVAALPEFHKAILDYAARCFSSGDSAQDKRACLKAMAKVRAIAGGQAGLLSHWLGQRTWPAWQKLAGDLDLSDIDVAPLELPIDTTLLLAYTAYDLNAALDPQAARFSSEQQAPLKRAVATLEEATQLYFGPRTGEFGDDTVQAARMWLRYLRGQPPLLTPRAPFDPQCLVNDAMAYASYQLSSGDEELAAWGAKAVQMRMDVAPLAVRALLRTVQRNRWLTPQSSRNSSEEWSLLGARHVLHTPLVGPAYPPLPLP